MKIYVLGNAVRYIDATSGIDFTTAKNTITPIKEGDTLVSFKNPVTPQKNFEVSNILDANDNTYGADADAVILALSSLVFNAGNGSGGAITGEDVGSYKAFAVTDIPANYLWANGALHPVATYPALFAKIGYSQGGSGAFFAVPNITGRFLKGDDGTDLGVRTGSNTLMEANLPGHTHNLFVNSDSANTDIAAGNYLSTQTNGGEGLMGSNPTNLEIANTSSISLSGSGQPHEHPNIAVRWAICFESVGINGVAPTSSFEQTLAVNPNTTIRPKFNGVDLATVSDVASAQFLNRSVFVPTTTLFTVLVAGIYEVRLISSVQSVGNTLISTQTLTHTELGIVKAVPCGNGVNCTNINNVATVIRAIYCDAGTTISYANQLVVGSPGNYNLRILINKLS